MMLNAKLLSKMNVQGKYNYVLNRGNLKSFCSTFDGDMPLQLTFYYNRVVKKRNSCLCYGDNPTYKNPGQQIKACKMNEFVIDELPYHTNSDLQLQRLLRAYIPSQPSLEIPNDAPLPPPPSPPPPPAIDPTESSIQFALVLDLDRTPRLKRSGNGEIKIHKRKQAGHAEKIMTLFTAKRWG